VTLLDNPLLAWSLRRARREGASLAGLIAFLLLFYGAVTIAGFLWADSFSPELEDLATTFHYMAWGANAFLLLLFTPARMAQRLARERDKGTLDMLRLTGLTGIEQTLGHLGAVLALPLVLAATTAPIVLVGLLGEGGPAAVLRGYVALALLCPVYTLLAGLIGLGVKKAQNAGSTAVFVVLLILGASGAGAGVPLTFFRPLALIGPWGAGLATTDERLFELYVFDVGLPGDLLMIPFLVVLARAFLGGLARRLAEEPGVVLGRTGAVFLFGAVAVLAGATFSPSPASPPYGVEVPPPAVTLSFHLWAVLAAGLVLAVETPVTWQDLVRGLARRAPDDPPFSEERLDARRYGLPLLLLAALLPLMAFGVAGTPGLTPAGLAVGLVLVALAVLEGALALQVGLLWTRGQGAPRVIAGLGVLALWFGPLVMASALGVFAVPPALLDFPCLLNPGYGIWLAAAEARPGATASGLPPLGLAMACVGLHGFAVYGLVHLVGRHTALAREHAASLVALPADAYGAPGTLTKRCPNGHLFAEEWTECPHCPRAAKPPASADDDVAIRPPLGPPPAAATAPAADAADTDDDAPTRALASGPTAAAGEGSPPASDGAETRPGC